MVTRDLKELNLTADCFSSIWHLQPANDIENSNSFYIEMPYGQVRPRLLTCNKNPLTYSSIMSSQAYSQGYSEDDQALWTITQEENLSP